MKTSEEVGCCRSRWYDPFRVRNGPEQLGLPCVHVFEDHDGGYVTTAVAVVWGRPDGYQLLVKHEFVALMNQLMCTANQLQVVDVNKLEWKEKNNSGSAQTGKFTEHFFSSFTSMPDIWNSQLIKLNDILVNC